MGTNKYVRDFLQVTNLKRAGRIDLRLFQYAQNVGDGYGGLLYMIYNLLGGLFHGFVIEGCEYNGTDTISAGYILHSGKVVQIASQNKTMNNSEWLYIDIDGVAHSTATESTALENVAIYMKDSGGTGRDIRFQMDDNTFQFYNQIIRNTLTINGNATIGGTLGLTGNATFSSNLDVDGQTNLDELDIDNTNPVDIAGGLTVHGSITVATDFDVDGVTNLDDVDIDGTVDIAGKTTMHGDLEMSNKNIDNVASIDGGGDAVIFADDINMNNKHITGIQNLYGYSTNAIKLQSNLDVNAKNLLNIDNLDVNGNCDIEGTVDIANTLTIHNGLLMSTTNITGLKELVLTEDPTDVSALTSRVQVDDSSVVAGDVLKMALDGNYDRANADSETTLPAVVMALEGGSGSDKRVLHYGYVYNSGWSFTPGNLIYVDPNPVNLGKIVSSKPTSSGDFIQVIGYAVTTNRILFSPNKMYYELL